MTTAALMTWGGITTVWTALLFAQRRARTLGMLPTSCNRYQDTNPTTDADADQPHVCVIVPVRNASVALTSCIQSILRQDYSNYSVIIVDDRSDDDTTDTAIRFAHEHPRITVERIDTLPPGWLGKSHALWCAGEHVSAPWLLFIDDDCILEPHCLSSVIAEATSRDVQLLTLWPRHDGGSFWEHLLIPLCGGIIALWFNPQSAVSSSSRVAFANGQFILVDREMYERIDGHRSVRHALIEDIPLAEMIKQHGGRCWVASGRELASVRMYTRLSSIIAGWARIYVGALRSGTRIAASIAWLAFGSLLPYIATPILIALYFTDPSPSPAIAAGFLTGVTHLTLLVIVSCRFWAMGGCRRRYLWLYPLSVVVVIAILLRAWWWLIIRRSVIWRGTSYRIDRRARLVT